MHTSGDGSRIMTHPVRNSSQGVDNWQAQRQISEGNSANHAPRRNNPATDTNTPIGQSHRFPNQPHTAPCPTNFTSQATEPSFPNVNLHHTDIQAANSLANDYLADAGNPLGIAQQYSNNPLPNEETMHLFNGEDINYWFGTDSGLAGNMLYHEQTFY